MPDDSPVLPTSRIVRWLAIGVLLVFAVGLYFREGRRLAPLTAPPPQSPAPGASPGVPTGQTTN